MTLPEPALRETRTLIDIPVVGYGESSFITASMLGQRFGVLLFIKEMAPIIERNVAACGLGDRFVGAFDVGFTFNDVLNAYESPAGLIDQFYAASRKLIAMGADVIIPGEAPLCVLLAKNGISRVDEAPVIDSLAATIKLAEMMVDLGRSSGLKHARRGYFGEMPPRKRVVELLQFYGISQLRPPT
jgi:Asp/Glu/hydantoin racemase